MEFVSFEIAKKLKEKGFSCELPFAMYNEIARLHLLSTAAPYYVCGGGYKYRVTITKILMNMTTLRLSFNLFV